MSTQRGNVIAWWKNVPRTETADTYEFIDGNEAPKNMEQLAKDIEIARANLVNCQAELIKAEGLLNRCVDAYEAEEKRRGLKGRA